MLVLGIHGFVPINGVCVDTQAWKNFVTLFFEEDIEIFVIWSCGWKFAWQGQNIAWGQTVAIEEAELLLDTIQFFLGVSCTVVFAFKSSITFFSLFQSLVATYCFGWSFFILTFSIATISVYDVSIITGFSQSYFFITTLTYEMTVLFFFDGEGECFSNCVATLRYGCCNDSINAWGDIILTESVFIIEFDRECIFVTWFGVVDKFEWSLLHSSDGDGDETKTLIWFYFAFKSSTTDIIESQKC